VRYEQLGFTVAPDAKHPFGTENCCVHFQNGTYLEPLAIGHRETAEDAALEGNTFVLNDSAYRFRRGVEGFSHVVFASDDAQADHEAFARASISPGATLTFSREFETAGGETAAATFKLAFAADRRAPDANFFTCQNVKSPAVDRSGLTSHENGVTGISGVIASETNPTDFQYFLQNIAEQRESEADSFGIDIALANSTITVLTPAGMLAYYGAEAEDRERGLRLVGFVVSVPNLSATKDTLNTNEISFTEHLGRIVVAPASGQGAIIAFEEISK
jgi:hypothetical protein